MITIALQCVMFLLLSMLLIDLCRDLLVLTGFTPAFLAVVF